MAMRPLQLTPLALAIAALTVPNACLTSAHGDDKNPPTANQPATSQDRSSPQGDDRNPTKADAQAAKLTDEHADDETPALGVVVGSCPASAVCVKHTMWGSPAAEADIQAGDYIMSVAGHEVTSPQQLKQVLAQQKTEPGQKLQLTIWREGEQLQKSVELAAQSDQLPESQRAWLGVMLGEAEEGINIQHVMPNSPAQQAGLRDGDTIVKVNDKQPDDIAKFVECVEDQGPNSRMKLTIKRDGAEQVIDVTLGDVNDAPLAFLRQALEPLQNESFAESPANVAGGWNGMLEQSLDELRQQIRQLQQEVRELRAAAPNAKAQPAADNTLGQPQPAPAANASDDDVSSLQLETADFVLAQRRANRGVGRGPRGTGYYNNYGYGGYGNRYGYANRYGYGNRYGWGNTLPPSPFYGTSYYRYGGRPYYYGGGYGRNYGFGLGSGIQLRTGLGSLWY